MKMQEETESKILDKIKIKMERIKANQKKIQGALEKTDRHHDEGTQITNTAFLNNGSYPAVVVDVEGNKITRLV